MFFANEQRDNVREENPGITFGKRVPQRADTDRANEPCAMTGQVGKVLGERWKALNMKQREPYEAKAKIDKQRYEDEKASYQNVSRFKGPRIVTAPSLIPPGHRPTMMKRTRNSHHAPNLGDILRSEFPSEPGHPLPSRHLPPRFSLIFNFLQISETKLFLYC